jgi:hypothetical protein
VIDQGANASIAALVEMNDRIRAELPAVVEKLDETNASLVSIIDKTGGNLSGLEAEIGRRLAEFRDVVGQISSQVSQLGAVSKDTLQGAETFVDSLEERHGLLVDSARKLAQSQQSLDSAFDERRAALAQHLAALDEKRAAFEASMDGLAAKMEKALETIEQRSQDVGATLDDATGRTANLIENRFAQARAAAKDESLHVAESMRAAVAEANAEMSRLFADARSNFNAAAGEIRDLSGQIRTEIEATRAEVRKGAEELPRETTAQAAALRRIVGDQVKALNELTSVVTRASRNYDVAAPAPVAAPRAYEPPPARTIPVRERAPVAPPPAAAAAPAPAPAPAPYQSPPAEPPAPAAARPVAAPEGGWLSSLMDRIERDEPEQAARPALHELPVSGDGLANLSLDIASMVDDQAAEDVWRRYQSGEKGGLFGRRLYTAQGRQTFVEIGRRYRIDPEFHATIDQYIRNFEELLVETSRGDLDGARTLALLTGDTGKVYTMLGHAIGRLD